MYSYQVFSVGQVLTAAQQQSLMDSVRDHEHGAAGVGSAFTLITLSGLLDISAAGAGQVKFPATQNASANANTLDDYEEGTWTPSDGSGASLSFTNNITARYTKIGRLVNINFDLTYPSTADAANAAITALPFAVAVNGSLAIGFQGGVLATFDSASGNIFPRVAASGARFTNVQLSTATIDGTGSYSI